MRHLKKTLLAAGLGTCLLGCLAMSSTASAEAISYDFTGTIHSATSQFSTGTFAIGDYGYGMAGSAIGGYRGGSGPTNGFTFSGFSGYGGSSSGFFNSFLGGPVIGSPTGSRGPGNKDSRGNKDSQGSKEGPGSNGGPSAPPSSGGGQFGIAGSPILPSGDLPEGFGVPSGPTFTFAPESDFTPDSTGPIVEDSLASTPIPEPGSLALFGGGLLGLALRRRRNAA